ncbi:MAG TPA: RNA methyltransferase [Pyrinomonadaceae bacterium]|nr:RNA methyltransferase [Pyrinomonadaceae bacterium]
MNFPMLKITSRDNQKIKFARQTRDGRESGFVFVEGARLAEEVLRADLPIREVFYTESFAGTARGQSFLNSAASKSESMAEVAEKVFDSIADTKTSQGIIVICEKPATGEAVVSANLLRRNLQFPLVVLLHEINNPNNLGAILRTAEAVDVSGVILTKNSADVFSPKAIRSAMGASLRVPLWTNADFREVLEWSREKNLKSVCADVNAEKIYTEIDWNAPRLLVFGSEAHGLSERERAEVEESLLIPMANGVESLNVAVACGIVLYEARR